MKIRNIFHKRLHSILSEFNLVNFNNNSIWDFCLFFKIPSKCIKFYSPRKRFPLTTITVELTLSKLLRQRLISRLNKTGHEEIIFFLSQGSSESWSVLTKRLALFLQTKSLSLRITALHQICVTGDCSLQLQCLQHEQHAARNLLISGHGASWKLNFSLSLPKQSYHLFRKLHPLINEIMRWRMSHEYQMHFITFWQ